MDPKTIKRKKKRELLKEFLKKNLNNWNPKKHPAPQIKWIA